MKKVFVLIYLLLIFLILLYCTSPSVNSGDSGEFITTSCTLGVAHSPGYPLYSLLGKIFSVIIPFGNYAYRINVMNVVFTIFFLVIIVYWYNLKCKDFTKLILVLFSLTIYIFSESYFRNAVQTEVFVLNVIFAAAIYFLLDTTINIPNRSSALGFVSGIALGNHHTIVFLFPSIVYSFLITKLRVKKIFYFLFFFIIGFSVYLYLPLRSMKNPYFDWGDTEKIENLYRVITRKDYGTFQLTVDKPLPRNLSSFVLQTKRFFYTTIKDLTLPVFILCILSFYIVYKHDKYKFVILLLSYLLSGIVFFVLANLPFEPIHEGILERFYILPNFILILVLAEAIICSSLNFSIIFPVLFLCCVYNISNNFVRCNYREYYLNYDYGMNILRTLLPNSILFMDGGDDTFYTLGYLQAVEKRRTDVLLYDRGGLVFKNIYGEDFRSLTKDEKIQRRIQVEKSYVNIKPVFYSTFNKNILSGFKLSYAGVLYVVKTDKISNWFTTIDFFKNIYSYRSVYKNYYDYRSKALVPIYYFMQATNEDDYHQRFDLLKKCYYLWPEVDWLKNNVVAELHTVAYLLFNEKKYKTCEEIYRFLLNINNTDVNSLLNLGVVYEKLGDTVSAEECYKKVIEIEPQNPTVYYNLAVLYWTKNDWDSVIKYFNKVLELQPDNLQAKQYLYRAMIEKNKQR